MKIPIEMVELQDEIKLRYNDLSKRLQQVAEYVLNNACQIAFDTVALTAKQAQVPPSTLIRFANAFGYSGFNEMRQIFRNYFLFETVNYAERTRLLRQVNQNKDTLNNPINILNTFAHANSQALNLLVNRIDEKLLNRAVSILKEADNIYLIGLRRSFSIATYFTYVLRHLQKRVFLLDSLGGMLTEQLNIIGAQDVLVAISFYPYAKETVELMNIAMNNHAKQIAITDSQISPLATLTDNCFIVKEALVEGFRSQSASLCLVQTLAVALAFQQQGGHTENICC